MNLLVKILLLLLSLVLLAGLACVGSVLAYIPWLSSFTANMLKTVPWFWLALTAVVLAFFVGVVAFVLFVVLFPQQRNFYVLHQSQNKLEISRTCIESGAGISLQSIPEIRRYHVQVKGNPRPKKLKLAIQAEVRETGNFTTLAHQIESTIKTDMQNSLGISPTHIKTRITPYCAQPAQHNHTRNTPRVL